MLDKTLPGLLEELLAGTPVQLELPVFPELALPPGRISIYKIASASREPNWSSHPISYKEFLAGKRPTWEKTNIVQEPR